MSAAVEAFLDMLAAERGAAPNTLAAYRRDLESAEELIGDLASVDRDLVGRLSGAWSSLAPSTVSRKSSALRQFFGFAVDERWRTDDPSGALPRPASRRPLPKILSHDAVDRLFERAELEAESGQTGWQSVSLPCLNYSMVLAFARPNWSLCRYPRCRAMRRC